MMGIRTVAVILLLAISGLPRPSVGQQPPQSTLNPARAEEARKYPLIVAYTVSWCPHCRAAKEYLTKNNIPFINRDVEMDPKAMEELTGKYKSQGVPVIVIGTGKDEIVLKGFRAEQFEEALKKAQVGK